MEKPEKIKFLRSQVRIWETYLVRALSRFMLLILEQGEEGPWKKNAKGPGHQPDLTKEAALREQDLADIDQEIQGLLKSDRKTIRGIALSRPECAAHPNFQNGRTFPCQPQSSKNKGISAVATETNIALEITGRLFG